MDNYSIPKQLFPFYDYLKLNTYKNLNFYRCIRFTSLSLFLFNFPFCVKIHKRIYKRIASDKMKISPEIHPKMTPEKPILRGIEESHIIQFA